MLYLKIPNFVGYAFLTRERKKIEEEFFKANIAFTRNESCCNWRSFCPSVTSILRAANL